MKMCSFDTSALDIEKIEVDSQSVKVRTDLYSLA